MTVKIVSTIAFMLAVSGSATGAPKPAPAPMRLDCSGPVAPKLSSKALLARFGKDAKVGDIPGAEGQTTKGIILYPNDPARRLTVTYWDDAQTAVSNVSLGEKAMAWTAPGGLKLGATLAEVAAANGNPFEISGFDWDYGGYVTNLRGGKLAKLPGGCSLQIRFDPPAGAHLGAALEGERTIASTAPVLQKLGPKVSELSIGWPLPEGVKASDGGAAD